ncbi:MAG: hypothetical protein DYG98_24765 [Haliscomenobacteraceae bacterium CHB4]|nr:hypothetical protein [Haliscomenobacteraceae bacterium CHB4]
MIAGHRAISGKSYSVFRYLSFYIEEVSEFAAENFLSFHLLKSFTISYLFKCKTLKPSFFKLPKN